MLKKDEGGDIMANHKHRKLLIYNHKLYKVAHGGIIGAGYCDICSLMKDGYCRLNKHCDLTASEYYREILPTPEFIISNKKEGI